MNFTKTILTTASAALISGAAFAGQSYVYGDDNCVMGWGLF